MNGQFSIHEKNSQEGKIFHYKAGRLPVVHQSESSECGLACLTMIAGYYGYETDLVNLRRKYSVSSQGVTLKKLIDLASELNLSSRALKLEIEDMHLLQLPCILHWEMKHFVVLKKVNKKKITIHDPSLGERTIDLMGVDKYFTGVALELNPSPDFVMKSEKKQLTFGHFWTRVVGLKRHLIYIFILSLLLQIFALAAPYYMQAVVDDVVLRKNTDFLLVMALGFFLLLVIETLTSAFRQFIIINLSSCMSMQMATNVFRHLIRLPLDFFGKRHMGDIISRFGSLTPIRELMTTSIVAGILDGILAIVTIIAMFFYSVQLSCIVIGTVFIYAALRAIFYRPLRLLTEESIGVSAKESSHFMESLRAIETIKLFQKESDREGQWKNKMADSINIGVQIGHWQIGFGSINKVLFGIENIIVIYFAAISVMDTLMTVGMMFAFMSYKAKFVVALDSLITKFIQFKMLDLHFGRLADIVFYPKDQVVRSLGEALPDIDENTGISLNQTGVKGHIRAENLGFRYHPNEPMIFEGLNFEIAAGESVVIVGPSGCGKSTLIKCLMGLIVPTIGEIYIDGKPLSQQINYRSQIAATLQDDQLLSGTIGDNISCFESSPDVNKIVHSAHMAGIHKDISQMTMQYHTLIGDMGSSLSSGQKQRIVIARALYREPKILFMDEATSHLDDKKENHVSRHVKKLGITRILVAHRRETIEMADRIIDIGRMCNGK